MKRKDLIQWVIFLGILGGIYAFGLQAEVFGFLQRGLVSLGIVNANPEKAATEAATDTKTIDYNWQLKTLDGKKVPFSDFRRKTIFINFWATWCPPCVAEMPEIQSLYDKVASKNVVFVMISLDQKPEKAKKFIERKGYTFPIYTLHDVLPAEFESNSIPTTFVISPEGKIVYQKEGIAGYDNEKFRSFLKDLSKN